MSLTQSVVSLLNEQLVEREEEPDAANLYNVPSMYRAARLVGDAVRERPRRSTARRSKRPRPALPASFILGGQIGTERPRLFQIYSEGNFIEATDDTPFFQIGEHKYGKPILDRVAQPTMRLGEAAKLILLVVRFDAALQPFGRHADRHPDLRARQPRACGARSASMQDDEYFKKLSSAWSEALRSAFTKIEEFKV